jgi:uncharacterized membrane protein YedE/YeeE
MMRLAAPLAAGALFGLGLLVSGMMNPAKVLGFLDLAGAWDPSLAFVMAGAIPVAALGFRLGLRRARPVCAQAFVPPARRGIDRRLIAGAVLFGLGWGLAGLCPGPSLALLGLADPGAGLFVLAMVAGMLIAGRGAQPAAAPTPGTPP